MPARLSVVIAAYNVEEYLHTCLESVARQTLSDVEVVIVDDGSTDGSGGIADEVAARHGWTVLHVPNGGLGRARNIGMERASGDYVVFLDGDDLVPRDAYELMVHALEESGSDLVVGGVLRYDGAHAVPSPLHEKAIRGTRLRTHITSRPELINDTTAWNKTYRRSFLVGHGLRFPEGVFYEDIPLTLPAHFLATAVDVLADPVYLWRERQTANVSITQRRGETKNLRDRMAAVQSVRNFLANRQDDFGLRILDQKVLRGDIPLFLDALHEGDDTFLATLMELVSDYLTQVDPAIVRRLPPIRRLEYSLIANDHADELRQAHDYYRVPANRAKYVRDGRKLFARLPFRGDRSLNIPDEVYDVSRSQPLLTGLRDVLWRGRSLVVDGHAYIQQVPEPTPVSSLRRVQLIRRGVPGAARRSVPFRPVPRKDISARASGASTSYDFSGFRAQIPSRMMRLGPTEAEATYDVAVQVATWWAQRGSSVGNAETGRALHPTRHFVTPDQLAIPFFDDGHFRIHVRRVPGTLTEARVAGHTVTVQLAASSPGSLQGYDLLLRRADSMHSDRVALAETDEGVYEAHLSASLLGVRSASLSDRVWHLGLSPSDASDDGGLVAVLDAHPDFHGRAYALNGRQLIVQQGGADGVTIVDSRPGYVLTHVQTTGRELVLTGTATDPTGRKVTVTHSSGSEWELPVQAGGGRWQISLPLEGEPGETSVRWLQSGLSRFEIGGTDPLVGQQAVRVLPSASRQMGGWRGIDGLHYRLRSSVADELLIEIDAGGTWSHRGPLRRERARKYGYRMSRRLPLEDTILLEAWKGRQFSDNPKAILEELQGSGDPRKVVIAVKHHSVEVPSGVDRVIVGSPDYYRALARSRWIISNDSMPRHFVKRDGMRYAQTWHGTPLKRLGFDMPALQMGNKDYLKHFAEDVKKWDVLVSPNPYSTEIFRRAFRFDGEIAEIGYPRNDAHYRPQERAQRIAAARKKLQLPEGKRVVLYAPTWRDNHYDSTGRYLFDMKLDLELLHKEIGQDSVLLLRGHQLVAESVGLNLFQGFVRNVSFYPDITDLYLLSDVLITDYSSVMFDFVNTGRPVLLHAWDLAEYRDNLRGFYFDIEAEGPGPCLGSTQEVVEALSDLAGVERQFSRRYDDFRARFAGLEDGKSSVRFIDRFL